MRTVTYKQFKKAKEAGKDTTQLVIENECERKIRLANNRKKNLYRVTY